MSHLPNIVNDLALILLVAGFTTLLFKKLDQPLVLGYIVAGFLTGPHFDLIPSVVDSANIQTWADIGVIFLMFALGLEFSFYKLKSVGTTAFVATAVAAGGMFVIGYAAGSFLGWGHLDCLFLGGMLCMSSTAIVVKAFADCGIKVEGFAQVALGMLIVEDIVGIVLLVVLPTMAASGSGGNEEILYSIARMIFFLILFFVTGMYLIPSLFKKAKDLLNDESLLVVSLGLCLTMVALVSYLGFSAALGAFLMGSLISEAPNAERIEHLITPVKDLFGAVFFVSVGMLVDPKLLVQYAVPVLVLTAVVIVGQSSMGCLGVLAAGLDLHTAVRCGSALCQIGEFSFILAALGASQHLTSGFLYPIVVAVSVLTTFATPFLIRSAEPAYKALQNILPQKAQKILERYTVRMGEEKEDSDWRDFLKDYCLRLLIFTVLLAAIAVGAEHFLLPELTKTGLPRPHLAAAAVSFLLMAPLLCALLINRTGGADLFTLLWFKRRSNHLPLCVLVLLRVVVVGGFLNFCFHTLAGLSGWLVLAVMAAAVWALSSSDFFLRQYLRVEARFLVNLNEKHMREHREAAGAENEHWFDEEIHVQSYRLSHTSPLAGRKLQDIGFRAYYACNVLQIVSEKGAVIDLPSGIRTLEGGDRLLLIGNRVQLDALANAGAHARMGLQKLAAAVSLRSFMLAQPQDGFIYFALKIDKHSFLLGKTMKEANLRERWQCMVIGIERGAYTINEPHVSLIFENGDLLWLLGRRELLARLAKDRAL